MRVLFVHVSFPTQYAHLALHLAAQGHEVVGLRQANTPEVRLPGVRPLKYEPPPTPPTGLAHDERIVLDLSRRGAKAAVRVGEILKAGFRPDLICAHLGTGEALFLKDIVPDAKLLVYCEFLPLPRGNVCDFDWEFTSQELALWPRVVHGPSLTALAASDGAIAPTYWQRRQFPSVFESRISVIHDGINTDVVKPHAGATFEWDGKIFSRDDEVVTFVANTLEPYRGFHTFMRSLPVLMRRRPKARIVIAGDDHAPFSPIMYSTPLRPGDSYRALLLRELDGRIDLSRVHFCGRLPYEQYRALLQISTAHVHLTYPFTLSWSATEAMASGCLVIGSRTPPVEEVITDGVNGLLVDFFSPMELADLIAKALDDRAALQPVRDAARQTIVERYDLKRVCLPAQMELIKKVLA